jgi:hypothetical protein
MRTVKSPEAEASRVPFQREWYDVMVTIGSRPKLESRAPMIAEIETIWTALSGHGRPVCVSGSPYLLSQRFDRQAVHLLDELSSHHFELLDQGPAFLETAGSCVIFKT